MSQAYLDFVADCEARGIGIEKEKEMKMIKSLMGKFQMNAKNAMDILDIPIADQQEFLLMLKEKWI